MINRNIGTPGNLSAASFDTPVQLPDAGDIGFGDLNGDGRPDLALASASNYQSIAIYTNNTTPGTITTASFPQSASFVTGYDYYGLQPAEAQVVDIDNDGKMEVLVINTRIGTLSILKNVAGNPPPTPVITSISPQAAAVGETVTITGANFSPVPSDNIVFFGAARGTVNAATGSSISVSVPYGATVDYVSVTNQSRTGYSQTQFTPKIAGTTNSQIAFKDAYFIDTSSSPEFITLKDMDNDGHVDIIASTNRSGGNADVSIYKNTAQDTVPDFGQGRTIPHLGFNYLVVDSDGDGIADIVSASDDGGDGSLVSIAPGTGDISEFGSNLIRYEEGMPDPGNFAAADLDLDGQPDIGIAEAFDNGSVEVIGNANGAFPYDYLQNVGVDPPAGYIIFADIDGDGKAEAIMSQPEAGAISVLQNTSIEHAISFSDPVQFNTDDTPRMITAGDLDGDGNIDLIVVTASSVSILKNRMTSPGVISSSSFATHFDLGANEPVWAATGDLDGDGKIDIGIANGNNSVWIYRNNFANGSLSENSFDNPVSYATTGSVSGVAFGDMNNDGAMDMVASLSDQASIAIYLNSLGKAGSDGQLIVYNGISPNGDEKNDHWQIKNIEVLPDTKANHVAIYNRWGDAVYEVDNYNNASNAFTGKTNGGKDLPNGTYFYKISFKSDRKTLTGYLALKK